MRRCSIRSSFISVYFVLFQTQQMDDVDYTDVFIKLESFYILIYIHDLEDYNLKDLEGLAIRLEGMLKLDQRQQEIHEQLIEKSEKNIAEKKNKKKNKQKGKKKDENSNSLLDTFQQSKNSITNPSFYEQYNVEESVNYGDQVPIFDDWKETDKFNGIIYDGKLVISLQVKCELNSAKSIQFQVHGETKNSLISVVSLQRLGYQKKNQRSNISLIIAGRQHSFAMTGEPCNVLGLDFLQRHRAVITSNYRPECSKFALAFTS